MVLEETVNKLADACNEFSKQNHNFLSHFLVFGSNNKAGYNEYIVIYDQTIGSHNFINYMRKEEKKLGLRYSRNDCDHLDKLLENYGVIEKSPESYSQLLIAIKDYMKCNEKKIEINFMGNSLALIIPNSHIIHNFPAELFVSMDVYCKK